MLASPAPGSPWRACARPSVERISAASWRSAGATGAQRGDRLVEDGLGRRGTLGQVQREALVGEIAGALARRAVVALDVGGLAERLRGFVGKPEFEIDLAECAEQPRALLRRGREADVDFAATAIDQVARCDRPGAGLVGGCGMEQRDEIVDHAFRGGRLLLCKASARRARSRSPARRQVNRIAISTAAAVTRLARRWRPMNFADAVMQPIRRGLDRLPAQQALQVLGQRCRRFVAPSRVRGGWPWR